MNSKSFQTFKLFNESLDGYETCGRVVDVYDGDTCNILFPFPNGSHYIFKCRLFGIDTPEIRGSSEIVKEQAFEAKDFLISLIAHKKYKTEHNQSKKEKTTLKKFFEDHPCFVGIKCKKFEKYGRVLVDLFDIEKHDDNTFTIIDKETFNQKLINAKFAEEYIL